jgi:hypothetical protein
MDRTALVILIAAVVLVALVLLVLVKGRKQRVTFDASAPLGRAAPPPPVAIEPSVVDPLGDAGAGIGLAEADMIPDEQPADADPLTRIKGLGPKAAARLNALGITRYVQLAELDPAAAEALDAQMGPFKGRLTRDRWIDQARLLAAGDIATFEAEFGKLGT